MLLTEVEHKKKEWFQGWIEPNDTKKKYSKSKGNICNI